MGKIEMQITGSFPEAPREAIFYAEDGGHADAIGQAVKFLIEMLPHAIVSDHRLAQDGVKPERGFGRGAAGDEG